MTIILLDHDTGNIIEYLADKYHVSYGEIAIKAIAEYYRADIEELEW